MWLSANLKKLEYCIGSTQILALPTKRGLQHFQVVYVIFMVEVFSISLLLVHGGLPVILLLLMRIAGRCDMIISISKVVLLKDKVFPSDASRIIN